jgi:acetyl esterase/lipase
MTSPSQQSGSGRRLLRGLLAAVTLGWAALGLVLGLLIVLPTPDLRLLYPNVALDLAGMLATEQSLLLAGFALLGLGLAALARRVGLRRSAGVALVFGVVTVALSVVPVVQGWRTATQLGVPLSLGEYFSLPVVGSPSATVVYARPEGETLALDVWRPPDAGNGAGPERREERRPAVVAVHGGGGVLGDRSWEAAWSERLAHEGYVVFSIDYRLGPRRALDATGDVKCAVGWVKANAPRYGVDPDRVALMGRSAGGLLALLAAYSEGDPRLPSSCDAPGTGVAAVAAFYTPTNLMRFDEMSGPWWRPNLAGSADDSEGFTSQRPAELRLASPTQHVDPRDPPTFLAQGSRDQWVPPEQADLLAVRLGAAGVPHRLLELPGARHGFDAAWGGWNQQVVRHELEDFLAGRLSEPDPQPGTR